MAITITKAGRKEPSDGGGMEAGELGSPTKFALGGGGLVKRGREIVSS